MVHNHDYYLVVDVWDFGWYSKHERGYPGLSLKALRQAELFVFATDFLIVVTISLMQILWCS
jgi:hypothetical protein